MTQVLVTGASGFLGSALVRALLEQGRSVTAFCRSAPAFADPRLRVVLGDLREPESWRSLLTPGISVFHLAAVRNQPHVRLRDLESINVEATLNLARHSFAAGVGRFLHVSSALIYGPSEGEPRSESLPGQPFGAYAQSRARAVQGLRALVADGFPAVVLCPTVIYGPDGSGHPNRVTSEIRRLLRSRLPVFLGSGREERDLVYVDDVVRGLLAAEHRAAPGEELILSGEGSSHRDLARRVLAEAGLKARGEVSIPAAWALAAARLADRIRQQDPGCGYTSTVQVLLKEWRFRADRARRGLGYQAVPLSTGLTWTIDWLRSTAGGRRV